MGMQENILNTSLLHRYGEEETFQERSFKILSTHKYNEQYFHYCNDFLWETYLIQVGTSEFPLKQVTWGIPPEKLSENLACSLLSPNILSQKCWVCNFPGIFGHFPQNVFPNSWSQIGNLGPGTPLDTTSSSLKDLEKYRWRIPWNIKNFSMWCFYLEVKLK